MVVFADAESEHSEGMAFLDVILGVVALIALWWRRRYPAAVGVFTASLSIVSGVRGRAGADRRLQRRAARLAPRASSPPSA